MKSASNPRRTCERSYQNNSELRRHGKPLSPYAPVIASEARQSMSPPPSPVNQVYNVAVGDRTTLNELYAQPVYREFRSGDVRHSLADISKAQCLLGYAPTQRIGEGLELAMPWYVLQEKN